MARPGVTYKQFLTAVAAIEKQGEKVTISRIREALDNHGSTTTISRYLKEWRQAQASGADTKKSSTEETEPEVAKITQRQPEEKKIEHTTSQHHSRRPKRLFRRGGDRNHHAQQHHQSSAPSEVAVEKTPELTMEALDAMDINALRTYLRRMESMLLKERFRREAAEKMAIEAKQYADVIKEQVSQRIVDLRQSLEETISQLKSQVKVVQQQADHDLQYYRDQLAKANKKLAKVSA